VAYTQDADQYINYLVQPNFKRVGPRVGKLMPKVKQWLTSAEGAALLAEMESQGCVRTEIDGQVIELDGEDLEVRLQAKEGWAAAQGASSVVVLSTDLTDEMIREGLANDLIRLVQDRRKELNLEFTDRIQIGLETDSEAVKLAVEENSANIQEETLGLSLELMALDVEGVKRTIGESDVVLFVRVTGKVEAE
jgi:isoleucyl-tRNA synthetase